MLKRNNEALNYIRILKDIPQTAKKLLVDALNNNGELLYGEDDQIKTGYIIIGKNRIPDDPKEQIDLVHLCALSYLILNKNWFSFPEPINNSELYVIKLTKQGIDEATKLKNNS